jgi:hypothetical protein
LLSSTAVTAECVNLVDTIDDDDGKLVVKQPKGKENNADYRPRH